MASTPMEAGEHHHQERQAVHRQMHRDAETGIQGVATGGPDGQAGLAEAKSPPSQMALESTRQALMEARATQRTNWPPSRSICQQSKPPMKGINKIQSKVTISALVYVLTAGRPG